jgi:hypothetical protein
MKDERRAQRDSDFPSPEGMSEWLQHEIADIQKAAALRIKDAAKFVTAYAIGEISSKEAEDRSYRYSQRWGDIIPGVFRTEERTDGEILKTLDETRIKQGLMKRGEDAKSRADSSRSR